MATDVLFEAILEDFKNDSCPYKYMSKMVQDGLAKDFNQAIRLVSDMYKENSLMGYLVAEERYEDAQHIKNIFDKIKARKHPNTVYHKEILHYRDSAWEEIKQEAKKRKAK